MKIIGIIPSRYASTRFPGKPLVMIGNKPMIQRVYEQAIKSSSLNDVWVATDDSRIELAVTEFGGKVILTSDKHKSGTDRCIEVIEKLEAQNLSFDVVVNIQGDEPFIDPAAIDTLAGGFQNPQIQISTLAKKITNLSELFNSNINKLITDKHHNAIYFSRHPIPFVTNHEKDSWLQHFDFYKHIGIYAYRTEILKDITSLEISTLEKAESLEQLRWIENGYKIHVEFTDYESIAVDTPEDLLKIINKP
jgi:3-deoxy-manno-octulosonate cytidylyltransferase (CMP-KDO synthetase)